VWILYHRCGLFLEFILLLYVALYKSYSLLLLFYSTAFVSESFLRCFLIKCLANMYDSVASLLYIMKLM